MAEIAEVKEETQKEIQKEIQREATKQKNPTAPLAVAGGIVTVLTGLVCGICFRWQNVSVAGILLTMLLNIVIHIKSYLGNAKEGKKQVNVLTMSIAEVIFLFMMLDCVRRIISGNMEFPWYQFIMIYSCYLIFNGASLITIPLQTARICGVLAILSVFPVYFLGMAWNPVAAVSVAISLVVNGSERIWMTFSQMRRKKNGLQKKA